MTKTNMLVDTLEELDLETDLVNAESDTECDEKESITNTDPGWTDYVISLLTKDELVKDRPRADGLCRVARLLCGEFSFHPLLVHQCNPEYAAVTCTVMCEDGSSWHGSAECHATNTDAPYNKFPLATAETRAIGRVMKRVLGLTNVLTAEEGSRISELTVLEAAEDRTEGNITNTQINFIDRMCKKLKIDVPKTIAKIVGPHEKINDLSHAESLQIQETLDQWSKDTSDEPSYSGIGPYDTNWKTDFYKGK